MSDDVDPNTDDEIRTLRETLASLKQGVEVRERRGRGAAARPVLDEEKENFKQEYNGRREQAGVADAAREPAGRSKGQSLEEENAELRAINADLRERLRSSEESNEARTLGSSEEALDLLRRAAEGEGGEGGAGRGRRRFGWLEAAGAEDGDEDGDDGEEGFQEETLEELHRQVQELRISNADLKARLRERSGSPSQRRRSVGRGRSSRSPSASHSRSRSRSRSPSAGVEDARRYPWTADPSKGALRSFDAPFRSRSTSPVRSSRASTSARAGAGQAAAPAGRSSSRPRAQWCAVAPPRATFEEYQKDLHRRAANVPSLRERIRRMGLLARETPSVAIERAIEDHVRAIKKNFADLGITIPVRRIRGTTYLVAGRKVQLFYRENQLLVQTGGGASSFWTFLHDMQAKQAAAAAAASPEHD
eukprot:tig00020510_g9855.t1